MLEQLAEAYAGRVDFYEMDCETNAEVPEALNVTSIPLVVFFKDGKELARILGGTKEKFEEIIGRLIA